MPLIKCLKCKEELDDSELIRFHYANIDRTEVVCPFCHTIIADKPKGES